MKKSMKTIYLFLCSLLVLSIASQPTAPVKWVDDLIYDFGDIEHEKAVKVVFAFQNSGTDSLRIDNVRTSCGCTTPDWGDLAVPPDSTGHIYIEYDAEDVGYFSKSIKVYFNGYRKAEKLAIEGYVVE